ncbi:hypothetical protein E4T56_gene11938 [Termitomyces sp. T112]|nr:hypothetical protein E4T56_gene11938 [Termitomyces sp. T112]
MPRSVDFAVEPDYYNLKWFTTTSTTSSSLLGSDLHSQHSSIAAANSRPCTTILTGHFTDDKIINARSSYTNATFTSDKYSDDSSGVNGGAERPRRNKSEIHERLI